MLRVSVKSAVTLLVVALFSGGAAQPEGCSGPSRSSSREPLPSTTLEVEGGAFFITGHAADFHAVEDAGAARLLLRSLAYVRDGSPLPFLFVESRSSAPEGHRAGKDGLRAVGLVEGRDFVHLDAAQLAAQPREWWDALSASFSALVVASDRALLTQAELDQLNYHRGDIARFMRDGRGVLAFSESGAEGSLTQRDRFEFLPFEVWDEASAIPPYSVTAFGQQALGLADADVNSPAYNHFDGSFGYEVITISDANGDIIALAGRVVLSEEYLWANAGPDATFYGPGESIPVTLDGSGSVTDPSAEPMTYTWMLGDFLLVETDQPVITIELPPGVYDIQLFVTNSRFEIAYDEVLVTALQAAAPSIVCPEDLSVPTSPPGVCGAPVSYPAPTVTAPNGVESLTCSPASGSAFPEGVTPVTCTVVDKAGASASCGFTVTVSDQEPPALVPPPPTTSEADAACRSTLPDLSAAAKASDNCTPEDALVITQSPAAGTSVTGAGEHPIQLQVTDAAGNTTTASTTHTVLDVTPPTVSRVTPSRNILWPPNHKMVPVSVGITLSDNCGDTTSAPVQCGVTHVTSNEPINGPGDGNTRWDWELTGPLSVNLRAERAGLLTGRIYTLWVVCTDAGGATVTATTTVTVPHDMRGR